jgi:hypothetical protein
MKDTKALTILRWTARILSILSIGVVLLFMIGEGFNLSGFKTKTFFMALFFPIGFYLGMMVAWKREGLGGMITVASLAAFYIVHMITSTRFPKGPTLVILALPGFLFLVYGVWIRLKTNTE